jgi:predicted kinase
MDESGVSFAWMLIVLSGLPGVGKTTIARPLAKAMGAIFLRIDSIEQALRRAGWVVEGEGYAVAHSIAQDNLLLGRTVVADCVNPLAITRSDWRAVAQRAGVRAVDVEIVCSNADEHRRRVESRTADIPGHDLPTWSQVADRDYCRWDGDRIVIDTARLNVEESVQAILAGIRV